MLAGGSLGTPSGPPAKLNAGQQLPGSTPAKIPGNAASDAARPGSTASSMPGTAGGQATTGVPATANKGQPTARGISAPGQGLSVPAGPLSPGTQLSLRDTGSSIFADTRRMGAAGQALSMAENTNLLDCRSASEGSGGAWRCCAWRDHRSGHCSRLSARHRDKPPGCGASPGGGTCGRVDTEPAVRHASAQIHKDRAGHDLRDTSQLDR